jgi:Rhs element Vgr protein
MAESPTAEAGNLVTVSISADGQAVAAQILSISVTKTLNRISSARLVLIDGDMPDGAFPLSEEATFKPGAAITIEAGYDQTMETIFEGIVVRHGVHITGENHARLVVDCQDETVKMTVGRKNATFIDMTDSDIITQLIGAYSLTATVDSTSITHPELVQFYATDWDFMLSRAEANGFVVIVNDGAVTVREPVSGSAVLQVTYGIDLMEFHGDVDARAQYSQVKGAGWDLDTLAMVEATSTPPSLNAQGDLASVTLAGVVGLSEFRLQTSVPMTNPSLTKWTAAQQVKSGLSRIQGSVKFQGSAKAKPGDLLTLAGLGPRINGDAYVSSVHHEIADGGWVTEAQFGLSQDWFVERRDLAAPPAAGLLPPVEGLQVGIVTKLDSDPENQNRIQVRVPVMESSGQMMVWARLLQFYASNTFGAFFVPEIGDEVVLGYFNHDPSHPVILGSLYSKNRKPPYTPEAENNTKAIVTRTKLKVEFEEKDKVITIITPGNNKIVLSDKDKSILLQDQNNNIVKLNPDGILMDSPKDIKINAKGVITIDAVGKISVTSSTADVAVSALNITNTANVGFTAKGNATAELSATGQTTVKGAMVMIN